MEGTDVKGFVTLGGDQCGVEGTAAAMSPDASRDIELVCGNASASVRPLLSYFSFERILAEVVKARLKGKDDGGLLPPRKFWSRGGLKERIRSVRGAEPTTVDSSDSARRAVARSPKDIRRESIRRRILKCRREGTLLGQTWGSRLLAFVEGIQAKVRDGKVVFSRPRTIEIVKGVKDGRTEYRTVASFDQLEDRVILNLATAYVRDRLEKTLKPNCCSFRRDGRIDHETAVSNLQLWRERYADGTMFVAECDIRKFFDSISHDVVRRRWRELCGPLGLEDGALAIVEAYLAVYCANTVFTAGKGVPVGIPQGGALSTVLANLVLCAADDRVLATDDGTLFYARYCDDVIFAHPDEAKCRAAMAAYEMALKGLELPMHEKKDFVYTPNEPVMIGLPGEERERLGEMVSSSGKTEKYYEIKTKGPFRWGRAEVGEMNVAPWVGFVGSQIRYDGETRIRKGSLEKHKRALGKVTAAAIREIKAGVLDGHTQDEVFAWYSRFRNRIIAKGVGYVTAQIPECDHCWAAAFGRVTKCVETRREMRELDRVRENMLCKVANVLKEAGFEVVKGHRYKGNPFSYHAFLMKLVRRPTSMRGRAKRICYSAM